MKYEELLKKYIDFYLKNNLAIIPIVFGEKTPLINWKKYSQKKFDKEEYLKLFSLYPKSNIAIITGKINNLVVLDVEKDFDLNQIKIDDETLIVKTPSGGRHFYFKYPNFKVEQKIRLFGDEKTKAADLKSDGGYVLAPPSYIEKYNKSYEFLTKKFIFSDLPEFIIKNLNEKNNYNDFNLTKVLSGVKMGERNSSAASYIGFILQKSPLELWEIVCWPAIKDWNSRNSPPLDENELRSVFDSISKREIMRRNGELKDKSYLISYSGEDEVVLAKEKNDEIKVLNDFSCKYHTNSFQILNKLVDGFVEGELIIVSGIEKSGKTSFLISLTKDFINQKISTLWFTYEMTFSEFFKKFEDNNLNFYVPKTNRAYDINWLEDRIIESKLKYGVKIVFIDHLGYLVDIEKMKNPSISLGMIVRKIKSIARENNLVIFLIHHSRRIEKNDIPDVRDLRDSALIAAEADSTIIVYRIPKNFKDRNKKNFIPKYENDAIIKVGNHRRTGVLNRIIKMKYENNRFYEVKEIDFLDEDFETQIESEFDFSY